MNPHDHQSIIESLKQQTKEIKSMPEEFDLDTELEQITQQVEPAPQPVQHPQEDALRGHILSILKTHPEAPSAEQIEAWKTKHGQNGVQVIAFDTENVFVFTHLTLSQWEKIQALQQKLQETNNTTAEKAMKEATLRSAVLWPKLAANPFQERPAGVLSSLFDLVLINSYFLSPQQSLTLTVKL